MDKGRYHRIADLEPPLTDALRMRVDGYRE